MKDKFSKEVARRILSLRKRDEDWGAFGERVGLSAGVVSNYKTGKDGASLEMAARVLTNVPGLSGAWLLTGEPPTYLPDADDAVELAVRLEVIGRVRDGEIPLSALRKLAQGSAERIADALEDLIGPSSEEA